MLRCHLHVFSASVFHLNLNLLEIRETVGKGRHLQAEGQGSRRGRGGIDGRMIYKGRRRAGAGVDRAPPVASPALDTVNPLYSSLLLQPQKSPSFFTYYKYHRIICAAVCAALGQATNREQTC